MSTSPHKNCTSMGLLVVLCRHDFVQQSDFACSCSFNVMFCFQTGCVSSGITRVESLLINVGGKLLMLQRLHEKRKKVKYSQEKYTL